MTSIVLRLLRVLALGIAVAAAPAARASDACAANDARPLGRDAFVAAVQRNAPAVVQVVALRGSRDPMEGEAFEFFQPVAGLPLPGGEALDRTFSSGFVVDAGGIIIASAHAVFDAREVWVLTADGKRFRGQVLGFDRGYDVAVLKIDAKSLPVVRMSPAAPLCPGAWIAAIGTPFGFDRTVTAGIVSAYPRYLHGSSIPLIQTDAALNPGSSGGPLFDADGVLAGMSTMIYSENGIYIGVSFALPADILMRVADALRRSGTARTGQIGARTQPLTRDLARAFGLEGTSEGALVIRVDPGSPADIAGLRRGDIVLGLARGERIGHAAIEARIAQSVAGTQFVADVWRDGALVHATLNVMAATPETTPASRPRVASEESRLGLGLTTLKPVVGGQAAGLYIDSATGSALLAGLERGDRILAVNGIAVANADEFDVALQRAGKRAVVALLVMRGGAMVYVPVSREGLAPG